MNKSFWSNWVKVNILIALIVALAALACSAGPSAPEAEKPLPKAELIFTTGRGNVYYFIHTGQRVYVYESIPNSAGCSIAAP